MMTTIGSLYQSPPGPQSAAAVGRRLGDIEEKGAELLELRTEAGVVYVCPSRLQRIRLRWAFRHFHVLPPQVLSRRDQRLIEKLFRSAVVTPSFPVSSNTVLGVVERMPSKSPASAGAMIAQRTELSATEPFPAKPEVVGGKQKESSKVPAGLSIGDIRPRQWAAWGTVAAVSVTVFLGLVHRVPLFSSAGQRENPRTLSAPAKYDRKPLSLHGAATVSSGEKHTRLVSPPQPTRYDREPVPVASRVDQSISAIGGRHANPALTRVRHASHDASAAPAPTVAAAATKPMFVSELPQGHVVYPSISGRDLVGELQLKAMIGEDGSVKEVSVLSGSRKLAEAGMRAVRRWHYNPYQVLGTPVEVETRIKISFFGPDAVSIASVGNEPSPKLK
jgi:hypothetical protein